MDAVAKQHRKRYTLAKVYNRKYRCVEAIEVQIRTVLRMSMLGVLRVDQFPAVDHRLVAR